MVSTATQGEARASATADQGAATRLADRVKDQAGRLTELGVARLGDLAEQQKDAVIQKLDTAVEIIRDYAGQADAGLGSVAGSIANRGGDAVERAANALRDQSVGDMVAGASAVASRHPGLSIGAASVLGFVAGRIVKSGFLHRDPGARGPARRAEAAA